MFGATTVSATLIRTIRNHGFSLYTNRDYIYVWLDERESSGITEVQFRSTDPGIVSSDLSLLPYSFQKAVRTIGGITSGN